MSVALSSAEAELTALVTTSKEVIWIRRMLDELDIHQRNATTIYGDNTSSHIIAKTGEINKRTKHIDLYYHFMTDEKHQFKTISLRYINTKLNIADIFTKGKKHHQYAHITSLVYGCHHKQMKKKQRWSKLRKSTEV